MCYLRRLFTLLKGQVGKVAMEASCNKVHIHTYLSSSNDHLESLSKILDRYIGIF